MRKWMILVVCVIVSLVAGCQGVATEQHLVTWVVDGDTLFVDSFESSVRIADIDAPELDDPDGEDVKWFLIELVYNEEVVLDCDGVDVYDRHLCLVYVDGTSVSVLLMREFESVRSWK